MDHQPIDKLLETRIKAARRDRVVRSILLIAAVLIVIGCVSVAVVRSVKRSVGEQTESSPAETTPPQEEDPADPVFIETFAPTQDELSVVEVIQQPVETDEPEPQRVTHEMQVVWFGDSDVPDSLTVHVMHDGDELLAVTLTEADQWYNSWTDEYHGQDLQLEGDYPDHINVEYIVSGDSFTLTATSITGNLPQTGGNPFGGMFMMLAGAAITAISLAARNKESK